MFSWAEQIFFHSDLIPSECPFLIPKKRSITWEPSLRTLHSVSQRPTAGGVDSRWRSSRTTRRTPWHSRPARGASRPGCPRPGSWEALTTRRRGVSLPERRLVSYFTAMVKRQQRGMGITSHSEAWNMMACPGGEDSYPSSWVGTVLLSPTFMAANPFRASVCQCMHQFSAVVNTLVDFLDGTW